MILYKNNKTENVDIYIVKTVNWPIRKKCKEMIAVNVSCFVIFAVLLFSVMKFADLLFRCLVIPHFYFSLFCVPSLIIYILNIF